jgi:hypothetical protein
MRALSFVLGVAVALALGATALAEDLNPQPLPPGKRAELNPQPLPPRRQPQLNPQPLPPGRTQLNPQPEPPGRRINQDSRLPPGPCKTNQIGPKGGGAGPGKAPKMACTQAGRP